MKTKMEELDELFIVMRSEDIAFYTGAAYSTVMKWQKGDEISKRYQNAIRLVHRMSIKKRISREGIKKEYQGNDI